MFCQFISEFQYHSFGRFFSDAFYPFNVRVSPWTMALASSSGFMYDNITLAVDAPIPETLISCRNISFSAMSKKPYRIWASSLISRRVCSLPLFKLLDFGIGIQADLYFISYPIHFYLHSSRALMHKITFQVSYHRLRK